MRTRDSKYWEEVRAKADELKADGCTGVPDFYLDCCLEHDIAYRTHKRSDGTPVTKEEADREFCECIQSKSYWGRFSPMAWWRWYGVRWFGHKAWNVFQEAVEKVEEKIDETVEEIQEQVKK